jgi:sugar phosphate permease
MDFGKVLLAVWNGPFHVGPLVRPVSVGDAIMTICQTAWRAAVVVAAIFICILAIVATVEHW